MSDFLPDSYQLPESSSRYMKWKQGDNRFRVLASPIIGLEGWKDKKPVRHRIGENFITSEVDDPAKIKQFWALPVWNYQTESVEILEITQKSIMAEIKSLAEDEDWGNPRDYDIVVTRTGEDMMSTEYSVKPKPAKPITDAIKKAYEETPIDLEALFAGNDPFQAASAQFDREDGINLDDIPL